MSVPLRFGLSCATFAVLAFLLAAAPHLPAAEVARNHVPTAYSQRSWPEPSSDLLGITQDADGYLWVIGEASVARFDGTLFEPMAPPDGAVLRGFAAVPTGAVDAGLLAIPGLRRADGAAGIHVWQRGAFVFLPEPLLQGKAPRAVFYSSDGTRWIGCDDGTVLRRDAEGTKVFKLPGGTSGRQPAFAVDANRHVWFTLGGRVCRFDRDSFTEVALPSRELEVRLASSRSGGVWVLGRTWLARGDAVDATAREERRMPDDFGAHFVLAFLEDRHGLLWLGTRSQGLFRLRENGSERVPTSSDDIAGLFEDANGSIWVATDGGGLNRLHPQAHRLFDRESGLRDNYSYTVAADAVGHVWLANRDGGVARIVGDKVDPIARRAGWRAFSSRSIHPAPDGSVWVATGIGVFRTRPQQPEVIDRVPELADFRNIRVTYVASNGDYWLVVDAQRVARWRAGRLEYFGAEQGLSGRDVRAIAEDSTGRIWLGAAEGALFRQRDDGRFEQVEFPQAEKCGNIQVIRFSPEGGLLLGSTRRGVVFLSADLRTVRYLDRETGLPYTNVSQLLTDDYGRLWLATRAGIYWAHGEQVRAFAEGRSPYVHVVPLGPDDGVPALSCLGLYQPAAWKTADGRLWFATRRGVLSTDPAIVEQVRRPPPVVRVARAWFDDREQQVAPTLQPKPSVSKIQLQISSLNLSTPGSTQIRVRLDRFDQAWVPLGPDRLITYPRLPPGRYVLAAMVSNGSGAWHETPRLLEFRIDPPWWRTVWFQLLVLVACGATLWATTRAWSHRRLRRNLQAAERAQALERERARIARDIHDDIGATLTRISLLTQSARNEPGPAGEVLDKIHNSTRTVARSLNEIVWAVSPRHDHLESLVYYLANFAQEFLGDAGIRCRLGPAVPTGAVPVESRVRHALFLSCREALNNVVKHSGATEVQLLIETSATGITVTIADNGRGFPTGTSASTPRIGTGNGLGNMQQHLTDIAGTCTVQPRPGGGTVVTLQAPLHPVPLAHDHPDRDH